LDDGCNVVEVEVEDGRGSGKEVEVGGFITWLFGILPRWCIN
jgi:hypothetical protein